MSRLFGMGTVGALTDLELLDRFVNGDVDGSERAFEVLVERHGAMVMNVCLGVLRDSHAAEDAFQATFVVLVRKARWLRREGSLGSWLHGVALRTARKARVSAARRRTRELVMAHRSAVLLDGRPDGNELEELLHEEIDRLPQAYRAAVVLCYLEGMSQEAAARQLLPHGRRRARSPGACSKNAPREDGAARSSPAHAIPCTYWISQDLFLRPFRPEAWPGPFRQPSGSQAVDPRSKPAFLSML